VTIVPRGGLVSAGAKGLGDKSAEKAVRWQQCPRLVHQLGKRELAPARQPVFCRGQHGEGIVEQHFGGKLVGQATNHSGDDKLDVSVNQLSVKTCRVTGNCVKGHMLVFSRQPIDAGRYKGNSKRIGRADAQLARCRIAQEVDVLNALA
jgi:uncharacterized Fe-S cluster protein YjdI